MMSEFARTIVKSKYAHTKPSGHKENWDEISNRVVTSVCAPYMDHQHMEKLKELVRQRKFLPGGRYLYAAGRKFHQVNNCFLFRCEDSKEGWADLMRKSTLALMSGGGIGVDYSDVREEGALVNGLGGFCTGPLSPMQMVNESGRHIMQGGARRSAIWAALHWKHPDVFRFIHSKNWPEWLAQKKREDFNVPAPLDMTNISVGLDDEFFFAYHVSHHPWHEHARKVYWAVVNQMVRTAEPGFSINCGKNSQETLRNACTEVTSADDGDVCNLGSLVLPRFNDPDEYEEAVYLTTGFLVCGSIYSDLPFPEAALIREKNRRLGLGNMGYHEWLLRRGKCYGPDGELGQWMERYAHSTQYAREWCDRLGVSPSVKTRAIAPNGTIGIVAETTTSIEPVFAVAFLRRYLSGKTWKYQYVLDPAAERLIQDGVAPELIEDAYALAEEVERRVMFQSWVQGYVDHAISSTINLPQFGSPCNNEDTVKPFGEILLKYLPSLRGITCYPDGCRGGQPLNRVTYQEALPHLGKEYEASSEGFAQDYLESAACPGGVCGV